MFITINKLQRHITSWNTSFLLVASFEEKSKSYYWIISSWKTKKNVEVMGFVLSEPKRKMEGEEGEKGEWGREERDLKIGERAGSGRDKRRTTPLCEWMTTCSFIDFSKVHFIYTYVLESKISYHF